jgi:hypothetical protein
VILRAVVGKTLIIFFAADYQHEINNIPLMDDETVPYDPEFNRNQRP